ncbi:uncharacterized protein LOC126325294 isoform X1 [Schistocerca gregaria]|uniref:uncharacterized protein LOC126325294 isoform X1 n=1 Tax=Schistocerca gregaria TaxID=7010 RepID=UPI00211E0037|nr:uncharacterized protein LOC126325294 isoform X1 [Schistocerca gregaria]
MGFVRNSVSLSLLILVACFVTLTLENRTGCGQQGACLWCDADRRCSRCRRLMVESTRRCVDACTWGQREVWAAGAAVWGRVCRDAGLGGRSLAVIVGSCGGAAVCAGMLLAGLLYLHCRRRRLVKRLGAAEDAARRAAEGPERAALLRQLSSLRVDAPVFLAMLNDTRRQVRLLQGSTTESVLQAYRPVLRDLARILILLNRQESQIRYPPKDWETLLSWGERVLRRYKKQNPHQVAQAQLVSFLQVPIQTHAVSPPPPIVPPSADDSLRRPLTTFQPLRKVSSSSSRSPVESSVDVRHSFGNGHCWDEDEGWDWEGEEGAGPPSYTALTDWSASHDYLVDDSFLTFGFRPQDEITTEL